ncbi:hypothetical protein HPB50_006933 [Hyalomma asiaticum]|uniref:Uncharacterized protein n=1 Tax=Hyalomma asiaticum TaxID=266040 RepID=A0ACB7T606_HYAAI|nr:hypothetical protein HPB50_006933 [Hyalomma asiaticum]
MTTQLLRNTSTVAPSKQHRRRRKRRELTSKPSFFDHASSPGGSQSSSTQANLPELFALLTTRLQEADQCEWWRYGVPVSTAVPRSLFSGPQKEPWHRRLHRPRRTTSNVRAQAPSSLGSVVAVPSVGTRTRPVSPKRKLSLLEVEELGVHQVNAVARRCREEGAKGL